MPLIFTCPNCDKKLRTPDEAEGRKLRCSGCGTVLVVTEEGLVPFEEEAKPRKGRGSVRDDEDEPLRQRRRRNPEDEEEEDRPRRRARKRKSGIPLWVWIAGGSVVGVGIIVLVLVLTLGGGIGGDKIKKGMTEKQVMDLLGKPERFPMEDRRDGSKSITWHNGRSSIAVTFEQGKVAFKQKGVGKSLPGGGMEYQYGPPE